MPVGVVIDAVAPALLTLACERPINKIEPGVGVGVGVLVGVGLGVGLRVDVGVELGVGVGVDVGVGVGVGVAEDVLRVTAKPIQLPGEARVAVSAGGIVPGPPSILSPSNDAHCI